MKWPNSQVPEKSQNSCKIYKKIPNFDPQIGLNCPLGRAKGSGEILI